MSPQEGTAMTSAEYETMAENCEAAARRLADSEKDGDQRDAATFAAVAELHRAKAERLEREERAARDAQYWWQERD
jgi:hypothetical protein